MELFSDNGNNWYNGKDNQSLLVFLKILYNSKTHIPGLFFIFYGLGINYIACKSLKLLHNLGKGEEKLKNDFWTQ